MVKLTDVIKLNEFSRQQRGILQEREREIEELQRKKVLQQALRPSQRSTV